MAKNIDVGFIKEDSQDIGFIPDTKLELPKNDLGFVPDQMRPDPYNNELELTLLKKKQQREQDIIRQNIVFEVQKAAAANPENWTTEQTKDYFKNNPAKSLQEEAIRKEILDRKVDLVKNMTMQIKAAPKKTLGQRIKEVVSQPFDYFMSGGDSSPEMKRAHADNVMALAQTYDLPPSVIEKNYEQLRRKIVGGEPRSAFGLYLELGKAAIIPPIVAGMATNPLLTAAGIAGFQALSEVENGLVSKLKGEKYQFLRGREVKDLLPDEAAQGTKDLVEILDFIGKGMVLGGMRLKAKSLEQRFTKDVLTEYKMPQKVYLSPEKVQNMSEVEFRHMFQKDLDLPVPELKGVIGARFQGKGVQIEIPAEKVVSIVDKPYWSRIKGAFNIQKTAKVVKRELAGRPSAQPAVLLLGSERGSLQLPEFKPGDFVKIAGETAKILELGAGGQILLGAAGRKFYAKPEELAPLSDQEKKIIAPSQSLLQQAEALRKTTIEKQKILDSIVHPTIRETGSYRIEDVEGKKELTSAEDRAKSAKSMALKVERRLRAGNVDYNLMSLSDHAWDAIILKSWDDLPKVFKTLSGKKDFTAESMITRPHVSGYRGIFLKTDLGDGIKGEIQIHIKKSWRLKKATDQMYRDFRDKDPEYLSDEEFKRYDQIQKKTAKLYSDFYEAEATAKGSLSSFEDFINRSASESGMSTESKIYPTVKEIPVSEGLKKSALEGDQTLISRMSSGMSINSPSSDKAYLDSSTTTPPDQSVSQEEGFVKENLPLGGTEGEAEGQRRKFIKTVKESDLAAPEVKEKIESRYEPITNQATLDEAKRLIDIDLNAALQMVNESGAPTALSNATAQLLIIKAQNEGNFEEAIRLVEHTAERATGVGQAIQALSMWNRLTPEGILKYAESVVRRARKDLKQPERIDYFVRKSKDLSPEEQQKLADKLGVPHIGPIVSKVLFDMAQRIQKMPEGRDKQIETALMLRKIALQIPPNLGRKLAMLQTMAQLLNPKTIIRNILGNVGFAGAENLSDVFGTALDIGTSLLTGKRTQYLPSIIEQYKGFAKGLKEGSEEARLGINLKGIGTRFDLPKNGIFDKGVLGALEKTLGLVLQAPDRASYQAAFNQSLRNQMASSKVEEPTDEMMEIAHQDGLYRTFQDENVISKTFVRIKKVLNAEKSFGMGDIVLKYPFTPANLLARGIEYSPFGFVITAFKLSEPLAGKQFDQAGFVKATSRAFTGTALMVGLGALLAALGIITGKRSRDRDLEASRRGAGLREYQINASALKRFVMSGFDPNQAKLQEEDLLLSYDWFLPASISVSLGANLVFDRKGRPLVDKVLDVVDKLGEATGTIADQPMVQGIKRLASGENIFKSMLDLGKEVPASFVPTLLSQIRQLTDNVSRNTKDPNYFKEMYNKAIYRIPGAAGTLPPRVTPLGQDQEMYQAGSNNPFNVFLNPAFVSKYRPDDTSRMVLDIWQRTGETIQFPRVAMSKIKLGAGEEVELGPEEYTAFQRYIGTRTDTLFGILSQNAGFMALDDDKKAKKLQGYLTDIYQAGKIEVLGYRPKRVSHDVKTILRAMREDKDQIDKSEPPQDLGFVPGEDLGFVPEK